MEIRENYFHEVSKLLYFKIFFLYVFYYAASETSNQIPFCQCLCVYMYVILLVKYFFSQHKLETKQKWLKIEWEKLNKTHMTRKTVGKLNSE